MATQTDVQQLIQGLTPSNNSGNPNTAYNNPNPVMDANGNWFGGVVNPAASITFNNNLPLNLPMSRANLPRMPLVGTVPTTPFFPTNPTTGTPTTPTTPTTPPTQVGGGSTPTTGGSAGTGGWNLNTGTSVGGAALGGSGGTPTGPTGGGSLTDTLAGIDWRQMIDMAGDALGLPGNWWLSGSQNWDVSNAVLSFLGSVTGLPLGSIATMLGKYGATHGWSESNPFVDHYMDNVQNDVDLTQNKLDKFWETEAQKIGDSNLQKTLDVATQRALNNLQGAAGLTPSKMTAADWNNILSNTSLSSQIFGPTPYAGIGGVGTNTGTGGLSNGGIMGGNAGNFGPGDGRGIGGNLSYSGGQSGYNNGVGAGTGFGASSYQNDYWGGVASGFGVGGMSGGARDTAMPQYKGLK